MLSTQETRNYNAECMILINDVIKSSKLLDKVTSLRTLLKLEYLLASCVTINFIGWTWLIQLVVTCLFAAMKYVSFGCVSWRKKWNG